MHRVQNITGHLTPELQRVRQAQIIEGVRAQFDLPISKLSEMQTYFYEEMLAGLEDEAKANIKMLLSYVPKKAPSEITGTFYALDLGGTNFRVLKLNLREGKVISNVTNKFKIPQEHITGTSKGLFSFIAEAVATMAEKNERSKLGFTFSFPVVQHSLNSGDLLTWTKGFSTSGVEGNDVVALLQQAFTNVGLNLEIVALCNDTVGTLVNAYGSDESASIGVILGTGSNAAYWEKAGNIPKYKNSNIDPNTEIAINMEWGNFDAGSTPRVLPVTQFDRELDEKSSNRGKQLYEKMISGLYLSKLVISILKYFSANGIISDLIKYN